MKTLIFGSCRVKRFRAHLRDQEQKSLFSICQHHLHNPYEVLQILKWVDSGNFSEAMTHGRLHNEIETRINNISLQYYEHLAEDYRSCDRIIIELSSIKRLTYSDHQASIDCNLTSFSHLRKLDDPITQNINETILKSNDFLTAVEGIVKVVGNKTLIIVPHYSWSDNGLQLRSRETLRNFVYKCGGELGLHILDPDFYIQKFKERKLVCIDSSHYTEKFEKLIAKFASRKL